MRCGGASQSRAGKKARAHSSGWRLGILIVAASLWAVNFIHRALVFEETDDALHRRTRSPVSSRVAGSVTEVLESRRNEKLSKAGRGAGARGIPLEFEIALQRARAALARSRRVVQQAQAALAQAKAQERADARPGGGRGGGRCSRPRRSLTWRR